MFILMCIHVFICIIAGIIFAERKSLDVVSDGTKVEFAECPPRIKFSIHRTTTVYTAPYFVWMYFLFGIASFIVSAFIKR